MPFINVKIIEGVFDATQKQEIVTKHPLTTADVKSLAAGQRATV